MQTAFEDDDYGEARGRKFNKWIQGVVKNNNKLLESTLGLLSNQCRSHRKTFPSGELSINYNSDTWENFLECEYSCSDFEDLQPNQKLESLLKLLVYTIARTGDTPQKNALKDIISQLEKSYAVILLNNYMIGYSCNYVKHTYLYLQDQMTPASSQSSRKVDFFKNYIAFNYKFKGLFISRILFL